VRPWTVNRLLAASRDCAGAGSVDGDLCRWQFPAHGGPPARKGRLRPVRGCAKLFALVHNGNPVDCDRSLRFCEPHSLDPAKRAMEHAKYNHSNKRNEDSAVASSTFICSSRLANMPFSSSRKGCALIVIEGRWASRDCPRHLILADHSSFRRYFWAGSSQSVVVLILRRSDCFSILQSGRS